MTFTANKALLISIRPNHVIAIFSGKKTVELRRVKPRVISGDLVVIYASGSVKGIVGAFEVAGVTSAPPTTIWRKHNGKSGLTKPEFTKYFEGAAIGYAIHIKKCWQLPRPIPLNALRKRHAGFRPPQSYHYWNLEDLISIGGNALFSGSLIRSPENARTIPLSRF